jgi:hypothetical protein
MYSYSYFIDHTISTELNVYINICLYLCFVCCRLKFFTNFLYNIAVEMTVDSALEVTSIARWVNAEASCFDDCLRFNAIDSSFTCL